MYSRNEERYLYVFLLRAGSLPSGDNLWFAVPNHRDRKTFVIYLSVGLLISKSNDNGSSALILGQVLFFFF